MARFHFILLPFACVLGLKVHVVPHTHDDVGWLKTVDQYYFGRNQSIFPACVKCILDEVFGALKQNSSRKFTYVEQAFFQRWYKNLTSEDKGSVRSLVANKQLTFANGGWSMHDEACPHYMDMIDNTAVGHEYLLEEFNTTTTVGWQLDPFGHSSTQASLLGAEIGFDSLFFGRMDYQDLKRRTKSRETEFLWAASQASPGTAVFTGLSGSFKGGYAAPPGFSAGTHVDDGPIPLANNVQRLVDKFVKDAEEQASQTKGNNILFTWGFDFAWGNAKEDFGNIDKLIDYVNKDGRVQAFYSDPAQYARAKAAENITWTVKTDDFFPYADVPHGFWSGYFTSRPALKRFIRESSSVLQVAKQIAAFSKADRASVQPLREALAVNQHHDAVTGTAKQHTTFDYARQLSAARDVVANSTIVNLAALGVGPGEWCPLLNVSVCGPTQSLQLHGPARSATVIVYNALAHSRNVPIELPVGAPCSVTDVKSNASVPSSLVSALPSISNYGYPTGGANMSVIFEATLPPGGYRAFQVTINEEKELSEKAKPLFDSPAVLENQYLRAEFNKDGLLHQVLDKESGVTVVVNQSFGWYRPKEDTVDIMARDGAYLFRPTHNEPTMFAKASISVVKTPVLSEVLQTFAPWLTQRVRLSANSKQLELTHTIGPIPAPGKDVISRFRSTIANHGVSYTDSNGREMQRRQRDFRPTWDLEQTEEVAGNYFPVNTALLIKDARSQMVLLTDSSHGGSGSVRDGEMEVMVHRRILGVGLFDDWRGVMEVLDETESIDDYPDVPWPMGEVWPVKHRGRGLVTRGTHWLVVGSPQDYSWRAGANSLYAKPLVYFPGSLSSPLQQFIGELPSQIELLSMEPANNGKTLLRLGHYYGVDEGPFAVPTTLNLDSIFPGHSVEELEEVSLLGTPLMSDRYSWRGPTRSYTSGPSQKNAVHGHQLTFRPMDMRAFLLKLIPKGTTAHPSAVFV